MNSIGKELLAQITKRENDISYKQDSILRNRIHLMAPVGWLNDPNGLCQMGDTYHIFFNMHQCRHREVDQKAGAIISRRIGAILNILECR